MHKPALHAKNVTFGKTDTVPQHKGKRPYSDGITPASLLKMFKILTNPSQAHLANAI
jgi:hypothetical protein